MGGNGQNTVKLWISDQVTYYLTTPSPKPKRGTVNYKKLILLLSVIQGAINEYLSPVKNEKSYQEVVNLLFGIHSSPLPKICKAMGLDVTKERLKLVEWKMMGRTGDPVFGFISDPRSLSLIEQGVPVGEIHKILQGEPDGCKKDTDKTEAYF
jgi:hypothetical protein